MVRTSIYVRGCDGSTVLEFQGLQLEQISVCIFIFSLWPQSEAQSLAHETTEQVESRWQKSTLGSEPHPTPNPLPKKISPKSEDLISLHHIPELLVLTPGIPTQPMMSLIPSLRKRGDPRLDTCKRGQSIPQPGVGVGDGAEGDPCLSPPLSWGSVENPIRQLHLAFSHWCQLISFIPFDIIRNFLAERQAWGPQTIIDKIKVPGVTRCWHACLGAAWETRSSF